MSFRGFHKSEEAKYMPRREIAALLYACHSAGSAQGIKAYFLFSIQYLLGLRIGEAILLRYDHLGQRGRDGWPELVYVPTLKKKADACDIDKATQAPLMPVPVLSHSELVLAVFNRAYRSEPREKNSEWLFPGRTGRTHLSRTQAIELFHLFKRAARLREDYTPHTLRHSAGTHLYEAAREMKVVTTFLRHSAGSGRRNDGASSTTELYVHVTPERWRRYRGALDLPKLQPMPRGGIGGAIAGVAAR